MRRYLEYQPGKARATILEDMKRPSPLMTRDALLALPDESLPELDYVLSENLFRGSSLDKISALIERYTTERILPEVVAHVRNRSDGGLAATQKNLLRYWIKHDYTGGLDAVIEKAERIEPGQTRKANAIPAHCTMCWLTTIVPRLNGLLLRSCGITIRELFRMRFG